MKLLVAAIICVLRSSCVKAQSLPDHSDPILSDILTILYNGTVSVLGNCTVEPDASRTSYWLSTQQQPDYVEILEINMIDFEKPIIILNHGWLGNRTSNYILEIRDAYLKRYDANVIVTDFGAYSMGSYFSAYCALPRVSENLARFLCNISQFVDLTTIHMVGHSLGGQLSGMAGSLVQKSCGQIGRITGLDPAGPLFQFANSKLRLDKCDARFVDVIHTNAGLYGYVGNMGHVDFYPNCGKFQPGCVEVAINETSSLETIASFPMNYIVCNHQRSCDYFAESINRNAFYSTACPACNKFLCSESKFDNVSHTYMGESCRSRQPNRMYFLKTNRMSPFGLGPEGPLN